MKRRDCFEAIKALEQMCYAGRAATSYYFKVCQDDPGVLGKVPFRHRDIRDCNEDLENTYIVRIFAEFESKLRDCWRREFKKPKEKEQRTPARVIVSRIADKCSMPTAVAKNVHTVRDYRNGLVHGGGGVPLTLAEARGHLLRYLGDLPQKWLKSG